MKYYNTKIVTEWIVDIFNAKSCNNGEIQKLYAITVQLTHQKRLMHTVIAQQRFFEAFSYYYAKHFRIHCSGRKTLRSQHKWDQPLVFLAFDMEGSRHGYQSSYLQCPHGHGLVLFSEMQLQNFLKYSGAKRNADGSMTLLKPAKGISFIEFQPLDTPHDAEVFADYAVKHATKLTGIQENYAPYNWYPCPSKNYPFWKEYADDRDNEPAVKRAWSGRAEDCPIVSYGARSEASGQSRHHSAR